MKILITGIAGFVGSTLARKLIEELPSIQIIGVDNLSYGSMARISDFQDKMDFYEVDVKDLSHQESLTDINVIIHCAAVAPLPDNQVNPFLSIEQNVAMCAAVSDFATKVGCQNIVFFSSGAIYEGSGERPCKETDEINTSLIYPTSKYLAEQLLASMAKTYGMKVVAIRLFNLYGPNQDYFRKQPPLLGYLIKSILKDEDITLYASEKAKRDYIYIDDLYELVKNIVNKFPEINQGEFIKVNAGSGTTYSVYDILSEFSAVTGNEIKYTKGNKAEFWSKYPEIFQRKIPLVQQFLIDEVDKISIADIKFAKTYFNWQPKVNMNMGLTECIKFAKEVI